MQFGQADMPVRQANSGDTFHFAPSAFAVVPSQTLEIAYALTRRNSLDDGDIANNLELHTGIVPSRTGLP